MQCIYFNCFKYRVIFRFHVLLATKQLWIIGIYKRLYFTKIIYTPTHTHTYIHVIYYLLIEYTKKKWIAMIKKLFRYRYLNRIRIRFFFSIRTIMLCHNALYFDHIVLRLIIIRVASTYLIAIRILGKREKSFRIKD